MADCSSRLLIKKKNKKNCNELSSWLDSGLIAVYAKIPISRVEDEILMGQESALSLYKSSLLADKTRIQAVS